MLTKNQELAKLCVHLVVRKLGGQRAAEMFTGIDNTRLSKFESPRKEDQHVKLFEFLDLDEAAGYEGLKLIALKCGFHLATADEMLELADLTQKIERVKLLAEASSSWAEHISKVERAAEDGVCSHNENEVLGVSLPDTVGKLTRYTDNVMSLPRARGA